MFLGGGANADIGPFNASVTLEPSNHGESEVGLPPLGSIIFDSHDAPLRMSVELKSLEQSKIEAIIADPDGVRKASDTVPTDVFAAVVNVALSAVAAAALTGLVVGGLVFRNMRRAAWCGTLSLVVAVAGIGLAASTIKPESVGEPRYEGLLANAPAVLGNAEYISDNYERYRTQLQQFIVNLSEFYTLGRTLPSYDPDPGTIRALHVSDLHLNPGSWDVIESVVTQFQVDVVFDTGDITDWGSEREAKTYAEGIQRATVPYVYSRGNHDSMQVQEAVADQPNAVVLDDEVTTVAGLTVGGIGDPRFTPDKSSNPTDGREEQGLYEAGAQLRDTALESETGAVDVALVHDPRMAPPLAEASPLVLAGHRHVKQAELLDDDSLLMVEGSTGGAGLRGLAGDDPVPLSLSVLYFDSEGKRLQAIDSISIGGHGETEVTLQRHVMDNGLPGEDSELIPPPDEVNPTDSLEPDND